MRFGCKDRNISSLESHGFKFEGKDSSSSSIESQCRTLLQEWGEGDDGGDGADAFIHNGIADRMPRVGTLHGRGNDLIQVVARLLVPSAKHSQDLQELDLQERIQTS
jgi:hypothetical protein